MKMVNTEIYNDFITRSDTFKIISDEIFKSLLDNTFAVLTGKSEVHDSNSLYGSKGDVIKEFYASLLSVSAEFVRRSENTEEIEQLLKNGCRWPSSRVTLYLEYFEKNQRLIEYSLINIGSYLPHLVDVRWKIDYIVKSSMMDESEGPIFRICLVAEEYDTEKEQKKVKNIHFTCNSQELQDLVYQLKDAVRHCHSITDRLH